MAWSEPNIKESTENSNKNSQYENINKILQMNTRDRYASID